MVVATGASLLLAGCGGTVDRAPAAQAYLRFHSRPDLKPPLIDIVKRTRFTSAGFIFIAPKKDVVQAGPLIFDNRGRLIWFAPLGTRPATDFRVQRYRGRPVLTWWRGRSEGGEELAHWNIYDTSYRLIKRVYPKKGLPADIHEFSITSRNTALYTMYHKLTVRSRPVLEGVIQEVDLRTGRLLFEWHSLDHVALAESYYKLPRNPSFSFDYFHINSIEVDTDGNLLVSARNTHTIYKINRKTGSIMWRLGGKRSDFTFRREVRFAWQHDARRQPDGTLTLFDNAAAPKVRSQSRGLVLRLDTKEMRAELVHTYVHEPPILAVDQANMQRLPNGHFLIGWGHEPYITEFGKHGRTLFDAKFGRPNGVDSYRAYRFRWVGRPRTPPTVAVAGKKVYVSWNGATEVRKWQLLAGPDKKGLRPVRTVHKRGFETAIPLSTAAPWIAVRALDRKDRSMARSAAVRRD
jgi:arylsulfotransferase ASST